MKDIILQQHEQITHSLKVNADVKIDGEFDSIVLAGLGGSGHPGDLLNALGLPTVPLFVHRNYNLPLEYLGGMGFSKTLVITSSYSGNTEETLTAYQAAKKHNMPILASAAGGKLQELAKQDNVPFCLINYPGMQPRHTLFAAFTGIYTALNNSGLARDITDDLARVADVLKTTTVDLEETGRELAAELTGKIPIIYATDSLGFAAKNFKIQANENAKVPAFWNTIPELNHNEMVGFSSLPDLTTSPGKFHTVMLHAPDDHPRNTIRMQVTSKLYEQWGVSVSHFDIPGQTRLEQQFYAVTLGLWTTYYLALANNIDPVPVAGVEGFKAELEKAAGSAI